MVLFSRQPFREVDPRSPRRCRPPRGPGRSREDFLSMVGENGIANRAVLVPQTTGSDEGGAAVWRRRFLRPAWCRARVRPCRLNWSIRVIASLGPAVGEAVLGRVPAHVPHRPPVSLVDLVLRPGASVRLVPASLPLPGHRRSTERNLNRRLRPSSRSWVSTQRNKRAIEPSRWAAGGS